MLELLKAEATPLDWDDYCKMDVDDQEGWKKKGDDSVKAMLLLMNSKNDAARKHLRLLYSQGNKKAYPETVKLMTRYLSTQYNNKSTNNPRDKKGGRNPKKSEDSKPEDSNTTTSGLSLIHI